MHRYNQWPMPLSILPTDLSTVVNYNGRKRIPNTTDNPVKYQLPAYSPDFAVMNAQESKTLGKKHPMDLYIGVENLGNYYQKNPIIAADQPFCSYFGASMV